MLGCDAIFVLRWCEKEQNCWVGVSREKLRTDFGKFLSRFFRVIDDKLCRIWEDVSNIYLFQLNRNFELSKTFS